MGCRCTAGIQHHHEIGPWGCCVAVCVCVCVRGLLVVVALGVLLLWVLGVAQWCRGLSGRSRLWRLQPVSPECQKTVRA